MRRKPEREQKVIWAEVASGTQPVRAWKQQQQNAIQTSWMTPFTGHTRPILQKLNRICAFRQFSAHRVPSSYPGCKDTKNQTSPTQKPAIAPRSHAKRYYPHHPQQAVRQTGQPQLQQDDHAHVPDLGLKTQSALPAASLGVDPR